MIPDRLDQTVKEFTKVPPMVLDVIAVFAVSNAPDRDHAKNSRQRLVGRRHGTTPSPAVNHGFMVNVAFFLLFVSTSSM